jgi:trigger factor
MELTQQIVSQAQRFGISPEDYLQRTQQAGQLGAVYADVRRGKALAGVVRQATVTDESGAAVDLSEFLGEPDGADPEVLDAGEPAEASDEAQASDAAEASDKQAEVTEGDPAEASEQGKDSKDEEAASAKA